MFYLILNPDHKLIKKHHTYFMLILGKVRLSWGYACLAGLGKMFCKGQQGFSPLQELELEKKNKNKEGGRGLFVLQEQNTG